MNFCFIPWVDWDLYLHSRPHQLVKEALRRGHRVLYVNPRMGPVQKDGNLEVWHPLSHPFFGAVKRMLRGDFFRQASSASGKKLTPMRGWVYRPYEEGNRRSFFSRRLFQLLTERKLRTFREQGDRSAIIFEPPFPFVFQIPYLKGLGYTIVYDLIDDWSAYKDAPSYFHQTEPYLLENADIIMATAKPLYEKALGYNRNTYLCPNAADIAHFSTARKVCSKPEDLTIKKPRIGFFGIIREWFDAGLMRYAALQRPRFQFCLIGGYSQDIFEQLKGLNNVHFLGEKDYSTLPQYLSHFDVTIIPFVVNDLTRSTNPIKVYEYLSGGKPVVSTFIPEVEKMPFVYLSKNPEEFVRNLDHALKTPPDIETIDAFLENHTWTKRFDVIEKAIDLIYGTI